MGGAVPTLTPLADFLPGMLREDELVSRLCEGIDRMVAPVNDVLDNFDAYLDVDLTSQEFVAWLGGWLCVVVDESWTVERQRRAVGEAATVFGKRGTRDGLLDQLALYADGEWQVFESGGCAWSREPGADLPGSDDTTVRVTLTVDDASSVDGERLDALVAMATPAHLRHVLEISSRS